MPLNAHVSIQKQARDIVAAIWEDVYAHDNRLYRAMLANYGTEARARQVFIEQTAPKFYEQARLALITMLGDERVSAVVKEKIYDAVCLDNPCRGNRQLAPDQVVVPEWMN